VSPSGWNFHTYKDRAGAWRWRLVATNGKIVADSGEGYSSLSAVREAARRVKANAGSATID
jgi:uncharacterized protein YegP (UPF0339 family)